MHMADVREDEHVMNLDRIHVSASCLHQIVSILDLLLFRTDYWTTWVPPFWI